MIWIAVILGIVEGLTEFLPISSTGHLIIAGHLLGFTGSAAETFEIVIQLGAILAVVWEYRRHLAQVVAGVLRPSPDPLSFALARNLVLAFLPAAVAGFLLHGVIRDYLFGPITVAWALIVGGFVMLGVEAMQSKTEGGRVGSIMQISWGKALAVGCAQTLALFPGVSRAGATIIGGMLSGLDRRTATEFSFYLAIPTMFAATGYDLLKSWGSLSADMMIPFAIGFALAFVSALVAVRSFIRFISHHDFRPFAWYRIVFGAAVLAYFLI